MKTDIHPEYRDAVIRCACGRETPTRATVDELHVEICSHCHPFFTGKQKLVDTAGRVERFLSKYGRDEEAKDLAAQVAERAEESAKQEMPEDMQLPETPSKRELEEIEEAAAEEAAAPGSGDESGEAEGAASAGQEERE